MTDCIPRPSYNVWLLDGDASGVDGKVLWWFCRQVVLDFSRGFGLCNRRLTSLKVFNLNNTLVSVGASPSDLCVCWSPSGPTGGSLPTPCCCLWDISNTAWNQNGTFQSSRLDSGLTCPLFSSYLLVLSPLSLQSFSSLLQQLLLLMKSVCLPLQLLLFVSKLRLEALQLLLRVRWLWVQSLNQKRTDLRDSKAELKRDFIL